MDIFFTLLVSKLFIFNSSKFSQCENIEFISCTSDVLNLSKFNTFKFLQLLKVFDIYNTLDVFKFSKLILVNEIQDSNKPDISITFSVFKFVIFKFFKFRQPENIYEMSSRELELKLNNCKVSKDLQSLNIFDIFFAFFISKLNKSIFIKEWQPSKNPEKLITFSVLKLEIFKYFKFLQSLNILDISMTLLVSKFSKSIKIKSALLNKSFIYNTCSVLNPSFLNIIKLIQFWKEPTIDWILIFFLEYNSTDIKYILSANI